MAKKVKQWYTLDNAGVLYAALQRREYSAIYRFSAVMTEKVDAAALQRAKTSARYGARLSSVSSIRVQNGAVEITLSQANNRFPALLDIPIPSKSSAGSAVPIGTGPYVYTTGDNGL